MDQSLEAFTWTFSNLFLLNKNKPNTQFSALVKFLMVSIISKFWVLELESESSKLQTISEHDLEARGREAYLKLDFMAHVMLTCIKLSTVLFLLRSLKVCVPRTYLKVAYFAFFQSVLQYGSCLWGGCSGLNYDLLLQKKAIRILTSSHYKAHCRPIYVQEGIMTVYNIYIYNSLLLLSMGLNP